jgi:hypothetical protein
MKGGKKQEYDEETIIEYYDLNLNLSSILKVYLVLTLIICSGVGVWQELETKTSWLARKTRGFIGLPNSLDYFIERGPIPDSPIAICDYRNMTTKDFYLNHVAPQKPCLFKDYAKLWPAYELWRNSSYLKEKAGSYIINAEK